MKQCISLFIVCAFIISAAGMCPAQTCRRTAASAPAASGSSGASAVPAAACGPGATVFGTPGRSGQFSVRGDGNAAHTWKGGTYKHPKSKYRR